MPSPWGLGFQTRILRAGHIISDHSRWDWGLGGGAGKRWEECRDFKGMVGRAVGGSGTSTLSRGTAGWPRAEELAEDHAGRTAVRDLSPTRAPWFPRCETPSESGSEMYLQGGSV